MENPHLNGKLVNVYIANWIGNNYFIPLPSGKRLHSELENPHL